MTGFPDDTFDEDHCPICISTNSEGSNWNQAVVIKNCKHVFHLDCITQWLTSMPPGTNGTCPNCRLVLCRLPNPEVQSSPEEREFQEYRERVLVAESKLVNSLRDLNIGLTDIFPDYNEPIVLNRLPEHMESFINEEDDMFLRYGILLKRISDMQKGFDNVASEVEDEANSMTTPPAALDYQYSVEIEQIMTVIDKYLDEVQGIFGEIREVLIRRA